MGQRRVHGESEFQLQLRMMKKSVLLCQVLAVAYVASQSSRPPPPDTSDMDCCPWKVVGGKKYQLVGKSDDARDYGCSSDCTYMTQGTDIKYCFKPGMYESECYYDQGGSKPYTGMTGGPMTGGPMTGGPMTGGPMTGGPMTGGPTGGATGNPTPAPGAGTLLDLVSLSDYPLAKCNDGSSAVYYRPPISNNQNTKKMMIYLKGGGYCVPGSPLTDITNCNIRCQTEPSLCTASTDPDLELRDTNLADNIGSNDPDKNPAFYDFTKVFVPYCSSDVYSGTRGASDDTDNRFFHGKYIVQAVIADLIKNTWITEAEQVVLIGTSAGAAGTELNCDYLAEELQKVKSDIDVKCVSDSGTIHPPTTFAKHCRAEVLEETFYTAWSGVPDQSCLEEATDRLSCISINTAYTHLTTPIMLLTSATDSNTLDELCAQGNFVDKWAEELDTLARSMTQASPTLGMYVVNCPFHVAVVFPNSYKQMKVSVLDSGNTNDKLVLRDLLANFVKGNKPYQAIDDIANQNPKCEE